MRLVCLTAFACACAALAAAPSITAVQNIASWAPPDLPNSGIAQGSIFAVIGTGLGPSTLQVVPGYPLPTTQGLAGTAIQVTVGGVTENCPMIYSWATAVAAVLPSATPIGTGTLTLTYQGATGSFPIQVVKANFGASTLNEGGTGPGVVTDANFIPITMIHPAQPGQGLVLWGTGLGPVSGDETEPPTVGELNTGAQVFVGNQPATVFYDGRSSSPGLDQINFYVPSGVSGCKVSVAVLVKGFTSNVTTISVAPAGQTTCNDTYSSLTAANLEKAIASGSLNMGGAELSRINGGNDTLIGYFGNYPLNTLIRSYGGTFGPSIGSCLAYELGGTSLEAALIDPIQPTYLDAGTDLSVTGPAGTKTVAVRSTGYFAAYLATEPSTYLEPGSYTLTNGSGGAGVGPFSWGLTLPADIVPTNIPASINRAQDLTLTWTGGSGFSMASIILLNGLVVNPSTLLSSYVYAVCDADASSGTFTVPSAILNLFPPNGYGTLTKLGLNISIAGIPEADFTVSGSPGLDTGILTVFISTGSVATIQ